MVATITPPPPAHTGNVDSVMTVMTPVGQEANAMRLMVTLSVTAQDVTCLGSTVLMSSILTKNVTFTYRHFMTAVLADYLMASSMLVHAITTQTVRSL